MCKGNYLIQKTQQPIAIVRRRERLILGGFISKKEA